MKRRKRRKTRQQLTRILLTDISSSFAVPSLKDKDKSYKVYDDWINLRKEAFSFGKLTKLVGYDATTTIHFSACRKRFQVELPSIKICLSIW